MWHAYGLLDIFRHIHNEAPLAKQTSRPLPFIYDIFNVTNGRDGRLRWINNGRFVYFHPDATGTTVITRT